MKVDPRWGVARARQAAGPSVVVSLLLAWMVRRALADPYLYPSFHALRATYVAVVFCFVVTSRLARLAAGLFVTLIALTTVRTGGRVTGAAGLAGADGGTAEAT